MEESSKTKKKTSPLMQQYNGIKAKYPDALLLFRVGDFYETFGSDAVRAAEILGIVLTHRNNGGDRTELAGFPHHSLNTYLPKLVKAGARVAICDQLEDPKLTKKIVKRGVTELITPGVAFNDDILNAKSNNFLAAVHQDKKGFGIALLDISTGEFLVSEGSQDKIDKLIQNFAPSEILISKPNKKSAPEAFGSHRHYFLMEDWAFQEDFAVESLCKQFNTNSLKGFGVEGLERGTVAAGVVLYYISETQHDKINHINSIKRIVDEDYVWMDRFTINNLELYGTAYSQGVSLLSVIDYTLSAMGGRLLKRWLALPLRSRKKIQNRQDAVRFFYEHHAELEVVQGALKQIGDLERLISKVAAAKISPREINQLKNSLESIAPIQELLKKSDSIVAQNLGDSLDPLTELTQRISDTLYEEAPVVIGKGKTISKGVSTDLDELRNIAFSGKDYLDKMLERETERTGIGALKIASNNVFGYYIEVRNTHKDKVPEEWIRKQTLVNAERYITEELKEYETKILGAEEKILSLEQQLFQDLVSYTQSFIKQVQKNAVAIAEIDCFCGFAQLAHENNYKAPELTEDTSLDIKNGRHPVIEKNLAAGERYITNDLYLDRETQQLIVITGPNMSGKSALLRQTALIVMLAQMGSFVPAEAAKIGVVDKIFTRVGASDNISKGESTFMVEMNETASILNNLSDRSLIILDEIGRGTSTYDGISIAWAIAEYLHLHPTQPKTLFATHYHELNEMAAKFERVKNHNVSVQELKDKVLFKRKLVPGGSAHSFGIHVAKMAGMPERVLKIANNMLKKLEASHGNEEIQEKLKEASSEMQLSFFNLDDPILVAIKEELLDTDLDNLTPVEALMKLNAIQKKLQGK